jgi:hypothetical protein
MAGYARVVEILDKAIGGPGAQIRVHGAFWRGLTRDQFINKSVFGLKLIELGNSAGSNLIRALKGEAPFDESSFSRMPSGRPPVPADQIAEIAAWIDAGAPEHAAPGPASRPTIAVAASAAARAASPATARSFARRDAVNMGAAVRAAAAGVDMKTVHRVYRIHPAIGIARMGDSTAAGEEGYFIGPEVPNFDFVPAPYDAAGTGRGSYRDRARKIRRQGARFRIYEYAYSASNSSEPILVREITSREAEIVWEVEIGNRKSFTDFNDPDNTRVPNLPGPVEHDGATAQVDIVGSIFGDNVKLGTLLRDADGRLIVLGGTGRSRSPAGASLSGLHSANWYDDAADGYVRAKIKMRDSGRRPDVESAWVITSVPAYGAPVRNIVTLWDVAYNRAVEKFGEPLPAVISFRRHIYPILRGTANMQWVTAGASGHRMGTGGDFLEPGLFSMLANKDTATSAGQHEAARMEVYRRLRRPSSPLLDNIVPVVSGNMPALNGDVGSGLAITPAQYMMMHLWARGDFSPDFDATSDPKSLDDVAIADQPRTLNEAALAMTVGGSFRPGIEAGKVMLSDDVFDRPFRINRNYSAGGLTKSLSVPWQADFEACGQPWWPAARPSTVTADGTTFYAWHPGGGTAEERVDRWRNLGFMRRFDAGGREAYYERERLLDPPSVFTGV